MTAKKAFGVLCVSFLTLFICAHVSAQTQTGSLAGTVSDAEGAPLPGAEVSVTSPALMGTQTFVTRADGSYRFPSLPPGVYLVKVKMAGFQGVERPGVVVSVGVAFVVNFELKPATQQVELTITAASPAVDTTSSKQSTTITAQALQNIPVARTIFDMVQTAPSVIGDVSSMVSVHGATLVETRYTLDGVDITDPLRGYKGAEISFDAVEEVEFVLSGNGADVGKASAGFINVVTKSGGNAFSGGFTAVYTAKSLFSSTIPTTQLTALKLGNPIFDTYNYDVSVVFGGPIIKDRLWFFLNPRYKKFERGTNFIPFLAGNGTFFNNFTYKRNTYDAFGKLTAQISDKFKYMVMFDWYQYTEDPYSWWFSPHRAWTYGHRITYSPKTLSNVLNYVIDQNTFADLRVGYVSVPQHNRDFYEVGRWPLEAYATDRYYGTEWGLIPWNEDYGRDKIDVDLTATRFLDNFIGANHQIKIGATYSWWKTRTSYFSKAPYYTFWYKNTPWYYNDTVPYEGMIAIENLGPDVDSNSQLDQAQRYGAFFEDIINIGKRLSLNLGVRYDRSAGSRPQEIRKGWFDKYGNGLAQALAPDLYPTTDTIAPAINNEIVWGRVQPRVGFNLDLTGDGRTALKGNYSRYQDDYVADMATGSHAFDPWQTWIYALWFDNNHNGKYDLAPVDSYAVIQRPAALNTDPAQITKFLDPHLSSPYVDEFTAGIQRELFRNFSSSLTFIYREHKNIPEQQDTNNPVGGATWIPYTVTEPGPDAKPGDGGR